MTCSKRKGVYNLTSCGILCYMSKTKPDGRWSSSPLKYGREYTRELVRKRDNFTCADCCRVWKPGQRRFDVHHNDGTCGQYSRAYDRVSNIPNLITICHKCHYNRPEHKCKTASWAFRSMKNNTGIKFLSTRDRALYMHAKYLDGLTQKQIGDMFGISAPRVGKILKNIK